MQNLLYQNTWLTSVVVNARDRIKRRGDKVEVAGLTTIRRKRKGHKEDEIEEKGEDWIKGKREVKGKVWKIRARGRE